MIVEGYCQECQYQFNGHWHQDGKNKCIDSYFQPYCPKCKSHNITLQTDEDYTEED